MALIETGSMLSEYLSETEKSRFMKEIFRIGKKIFGVECDTNTIRTPFEFDSTESTRLH
jgi:hypothetical protein